MTGRTVVDSGHVMARQSRRRRARVALAVAILTTMAIGAWTIVRSSVLDLRSLSIELKLNPTSSLTKQEIASAADVRIGQPLVDVDPARIQAAIASMPGVRSVAVERRWPHTLAITVSARRAEVVIESSGTRFLVDQDGVPFAELAAASPESAAVLSLPVVTLTNPGAGHNHRALSVGDRPQEDLARIARAAASLGPTITVRSRDLTWGKDGLRFEIGGVRVIWGGSPRVAGKRAELLSTLQVVSQRPKVLNVSAGDVLVTRKRPRHAGNGNRITRRP